MCKVVSFTRKIAPIVFHYNIYGSVYERCTSITDLGFVYDYKLSFSTHISNIVKDSTKRLGFLIRSSRDFNSIFVLKTMHFSLIRSKLDYNSN